MIFIAAVELRKEKLVKKTKHGWNISNKNKYKGDPYTTKVNILNSKHFESKI